MGGLMGTAMSSRGFAGAVIDGGVRDIAQLKRIGFPVYATGPVPSTSVSHYRFAGVNIPLDVEGLTSRPTTSSSPTRTAWSLCRGHAPQRS